MSWFSRRSAWPRISDQIQDLALKLKSSAKKTKGDAKSCPCPWCGGINLSVLDGVPDVLECPPVERLCSRCKQPVLYTYEYDMAENKIDITAHACPQNAEPVG